MKCSAAILRTTGAEKPYTKSQPLSIASRSDLITGTLRYLLLGEHLSPESRRLVLFMLLLDLALLSTPHHEGRAAPRDGGATEREEWPRVPVEHGARVG